MFGGRRRHAAQNAFHSAASSPASSGALSPAAADAPAIQKTPREGIPGAFCLVGAYASSGTVSILKTLMTLTSGQQKVHAPWLPPGGVPP